MSVEELETEIKRLSASDFEALAVWFVEYQQQRWDVQISEDLRAGRLDNLLKEAHGEFEAGQIRAM